MGWRELQSNEVLVLPGDAESRRFGFRVLNAQCGARSQGKEDTLSSALSSQNYDLVVVRYSVLLTGIDDLLAKLDKQIIYTDSTVYWGISIRHNLSHKTPLNVKVQRVDGNFIDVIERVVNSSFSGYHSHWHDNVRTRGIRMEDAYNEWVRSKITSEESRCYLMYVDDEPAGFALTDTRDQVGEILLAGISREFQSKGLYQHLLAHIETEMHQYKVEELVISTQSQNSNVQKAWERYGLVPLLTVRTVHVENRKSY